MNGRDPYEVEDLLTSVVLGAASYASAEDALIPFLREARDGARRIVLPDVASAECTFWPNWAALQGPDGSVVAAASQPEVLVTITDPRGDAHVLLIEAKLYSGVSSASMSEDEPVGHQLAKYLVQLRARADTANVLGVVYLTIGITPPLDDIEAAREELRAKNHDPSDIWWLSWRRFERVAKTDAPVLRDAVRLLRERWELSWVDDAWAWPAPIRPGMWSFQSSWRWPSPPSPPDPRWFHV